MKNIFKKFVIGVVDFIVIAGIILEFALMLVLIGA